MSCRYGLPGRIYGSSETNTGAVVEPQPAARLLPPRHLQSFAAPDSLQAVLTDSRQSSTPEAKISIRIYCGLKYDISDRSQLAIVSADPFTAIARRA